MDDILIYASNKQELDRCTNAVIKRIEGAALTLTKGKCEFGREKHIRFNNWSKKKLKQSQAVLNVKEARTHPDRSQKLAVIIRIDSQLKIFMSKHFIRNRP